MKNKKYITPKTQVKVIDTEMPIAQSVTIDNTKIVPDAYGGFAKKGSSIWEEN